MPSLLLLLAACEPFDLLEQRLDPVPFQTPTATLPAGLPEDCDQDGDGAVRDDPGCVALAAALDCDDQDSTVYPGAPEFCDGRDGDCDGHPDGPDPIDGATWFLDADSDGWGAPGTAFRSCLDTVLGASFVDGDCDDASETAYPGAPEICGDAVDQDCDGADASLLEEGLSCAWVSLDGAPGSFAGAGVAATRDLTCDGAPDLAVAAPDQGETGQTRLYPGPLSPGQAPSVLATLHTPELAGLSGTLVALGDLDGDGCDDVALAQQDLGEPSDVAAWLLLGDGQADDRLVSHSTLTASGLTGTALAVTGTGGRPELLVLAPGQDQAWLVGELDAGTAALDTAAGLVLTASPRLGQLGQVAALGDLDGDGLAEIVLGDPTADDAAGRVLVVPGDTGERTVTEDDVVLSGRIGAGLGAALVIAGDLDADGLADLVVGAPDEAVAGDDRAGAVRVLLGGELSAGASGTLFGAAGQRLGAALVAPGNLTPDRDDRPDLIVAGGTDGTLYWFARTDAAGLTVPEQLGPSGLGGAGVVLAPGGDLDLDGLPDVLVGMPSEDRVKVLVAAQFDP